MIRDFLGYQYQSSDYPYTDKSYHSYAYDNPVSNSSIRSPRVYAHRRTPSNNSGTLGMNNTSGYQVEGEEGPEMFYSPYSRRAGDFSGYFSRQNSLESSSGERPTLLELGMANKLRSSLKRSNYLSPSVRSQNAGGGSSSSGPGK